jgi:hypothetical protein
MIDVSKLNLGSNDVDTHEVADFISIHQIQTGHIVTLEVPVERYISLRLSLSVSVNLKLIDVKSIVYLVQVGELAAMTSDYKKATTARESLEATHFAGLLGAK